MYRGSALFCMHVEELAQLASYTTYVAKFTYEQYATINQTNTGRFDPRVFVNCLQVSSKQTCKQLTKTLGSKRPAFV